MNIRERFEEIWPVPEGVEWSSITGCYFAHYHMAQEYAAEHSARLDTFTRCQETTDVYVSLIGDLVNELEWSYSFLPRGKTYSTCALDRAKQIMEKKK